MTNNLTDIGISRPIAAARVLGDLAPDRHSFFKKHVLINAEPTVLDSQNCRRCFLDSLRLLIRFCESITVYIPGDSELREEARTLAKRLAFRTEVDFPTSMSGLSQFDAILSIGTTARPDLPWTVINSNGWIARVSSGEKSLPSECGQWNPVGALASASLGVAEIFKRLINLKPERAGFFNGLSFSFHSYTSDASDPGPELPSSIVLECVLVGVGAIGNGIVHLLNALPITGRTWVVDQQEFRDENLTTCILIGPGDLRTPKAVLAERILDKISARGFAESIERFKQRLGTEVPPPRIVVTALDEIEPRHRAQEMWPDVVVDGAIGDFACEASVHPWGPNLSCLICDFQHQVQRAEDLQTKYSGLSPERVRDADSLVTETDIEIAPANKKEWLRTRLGKQVCSVISEAMAEMISQSSQEEGFRPSVPFTACLSSCMVVTELVRYVLKWPAVLETGFQFDSLIGPEYGRAKSHSRKPNCLCVERRDNIMKLRARRGFY